MAITTTTPSRRAVIGALVASPLVIAAPAAAAQTYEFEHVYAQYQKALFDLNSAPVDSLDDENDKTADIFFYWLDRLENTPAPTPVHFAKKFAAVWHDGVPPPADVVEKIVMEARQLAGLA